MNEAFYICISMGLFLIGCCGLLLRRNTLTVLLCIEMMLNGANLLFVNFAHQKQDETGLVWVFFVLVIAAAEAATGMALTIHLFRSKQSVDIDQYNTLKG